MERVPSQEKPDLALLSPRPLAGPVGLVGSCGRDFALGWALAGVQLACSAGADKQSGVQGGTPALPLPSLSTAPAGGPSRQAQGSLGRVGSNARLASSVLPGAWPGPFAVSPWLRCGCPFTQGGRRACWSPTPLSLLSPQALYLLLLLGVPGCALAQPLCKEEEYPVGNECCPKCSPGREGPPWNQGSELGGGGAGAPLGGGLGVPLPKVPLWELPRSPGDLVASSHLRGVGLPCLAGYHVVRACGNESGTVCAPCPGETYTAHYNGLSKCLPCRECHAGRGTSGWHRLPGRELPATVSPQGG